LSKDVKINWMKFHSTNDIRREIQSISSLELELYKIKGLNYRPHLKHLKYNILVKYYFQNSLNSLFKGAFARYPIVTTRLRKCNSHFNRLLCCADV
jgi:hypothetical protein